MLIRRFRTKFYKPIFAMWTDAYQSYYSAGDEAECFCGRCEEIILGDNDEEICTKCGQRNILH